MSPGWYPDPMRRFEHRYFNGDHWTADVATNGRRFVDTLPTPGASPVPPPPPGAYGAPSGNGRSGLAVAALVLGIIGAGGGWIPFVAFLAIVAAILAIIFGLAARRRARASGGSTGMATTGTVLGVVGIASSIVGIALTVWAYRAIERYERPADNVTVLNRCTTTGGRIEAGGTLKNLSDDTESFTIRVRLTGDRARDVELVHVDDVDPGATVDWSAGSFAAGAGEPDCEIVDVHGPLPFGIDPDA